MRTTWVKGVRHVVLSDDDDDHRDNDCSHKSDQKTSSTRDLQWQRHRKKNGAVAVCNNRPSTVAIDGKAANHRDSDQDDHDQDHDNQDYDEDDDDNYVERVLQWLQKPAAVVSDTCRKPKTAPENGGVCCRRPALVKTCSIPENDKFEHRQAVKNINKRPMMSPSARNSVKNHKTELHVHMPSVCPSAAAASNENIKNIDDDLTEILSR